MAKIRAHRFVLPALVVGWLLAPATAPAVTVGKPAPEFTLPSTGGPPASLGQFRGKKMVLLQFYAINSGTT